MGLVAAPTPQTLSLLSALQRGELMALPLSPEPSLPFSQSTQGAGHFRETKQPEFGVEGSV